MSKRGRPLKIDSKSEPIRIRLTKEQMYWLKTIMNKTNKNRTETVAYTLKIVFNLMK